MVSMVVFLVGTSSRVLVCPIFSEVLGAGGMGNICVVFKEVTSIGRMTSPRRRNRTNCKMLKEWESEDGGTLTGMFSHTLRRYFWCDIVPFF